MQFLFSVDDSQMRVSSWIWIDACVVEGHFSNDPVNWNRSFTDKIALDDKQLYTKILHAKSHSFIIRNKNFGR